MYFIELLVKRFLKNEKPIEGYDPLTELEEEEDKCEHIFMPLDSSGEFLACKNCGLTVNRKDLKDINFFKRPIL